MTIRNDATRQQIVTRDRRRPRAVVSRQGQVLLDTDFDQQARHVSERIEIETIDVLGSPGRLAVPAGTNGFRITPDGAPANFNIGAGHGFLGGWLIENPAACKLGTQPHPRSGDVITSPGVILIKAIVRHVDPVEEPALADVALGDAQASGRALNDWQVLPLAVPSGGTGLACSTVLTTAEWQALAAPSTGTLAVLKAAAAPSADPCSLTPGGGYTRLENLLYRVEVHGGDAKAGFPSVDGPRFGLHNLKLKVSRRNASVMAAITTISGGTTVSEIGVSPPALDPRNWFVPGQYAEIVSIHDDVDPRAALANERLFRVALATDDKVTLEASAAQLAATGAATNGRWFLRLWDSLPATGAGGGTSGIATVSAPGGAAESAVIDLGDGLSIRLAGGPAAIFRRGDYWTCAARADGSIGWPDSGGGGDAMSPHGPETRYAPLAVATGSPTAVAVMDCVVPFATLTDKTLGYRGGDGQTVYAPLATTGTMVQLPATLRVAVMRGETPVPGAAVRWSLVPPSPSPASQINGTLCDTANSPITTTDSNGLAEVTWSIDASQQLVRHQVQATLLGAGVGTPPVVFSARFETAAQTMYRPGKCVHLAGVQNVQDALDALCAKIGDNNPPALTLRSIVLTDAKAKSIELIKEKLILNGLEVPFNAFAANIFFGFDAPLAIAPRGFDPIAEIEIDLPYPTTDPDKAYWIEATRPLSTVSSQGIISPFGFHRIRLDGTIEVVGKGEVHGLVWKPSPMAKRVLESFQRHAGGQRAFDPNVMKQGWLKDPLFERLLCRLRLRSALIWAVDLKTKQRLYLNAEHLGTNDWPAAAELRVDDRDPQRAADLDMFIYLSLTSELKPPPKAGGKKIGIARMKDSSTAAGLNAKR